METTGQTQFLFEKDVESLSFSFVLSPPRRLADSGHKTELVAKRRLSMSPLSRKSGGLSPLDGVLSSVNENILTIPEDACLTRDGSKCSNPDEASETSGKPFLIRQHTSSRCEGAGINTITADPCDCGDANQKASDTDLPPPQRSESPTKSAVRDLRNRRRSTSLRDSAAWNEALQAKQEKLMEDLKQVGVCVGGTPGSELSADVPRGPSPGGSVRRSVQRLRSRNRESLELFSSAGDLQNNGNAQEMVGSSDVRGNLSPAIQPKTGLDCQDWPVSKLTESFDLDSAFQKSEGFFDDDDLKASYAKSGDRQFNMNSSRPFYRSTNGHPLSGNLVEQHQTGNSRNSVARASLRESIAWDHAMLSGKGLLDADELFLDTSTPVAHLDLKDLPTFDAMVAVPSTVHGSPVRKHDGVAGGNGSNAVDSDRKKDGNAGGDIKKENDEVTRNVTSPLAPSISSSGSVVKTTTSNIAPGEAPQSVVSSTAATTSAKHPPPPPQAKAALSRIQPPSARPKLSSLKSAKSKIPSNPPLEALSQLDMSSKPRASDPPVPVPSVSSGAPVKKASVSQPTLAPAPITGSVTRSVNPITASNRSRPQFPNTTLPPSRPPSSRNPAPPDPKKTNVNPRGAPPPRWGAPPPPRPVARPVTSSRPTQKVGAMPTLRKSVQSLPTGCFAPPVTAPRQGYGSQRMGSSQLSRREGKDSIDSSLRSSTESLAGLPRLSRLHMGGDRIAQREDASGTDVLNQESGDSTRPGLRRPVSKMTDAAFSEDPQSSARDWVPDSGSTASSTPRSQSPPSSFYPDASISPVPKQKSISRQQSASSFSNTSDETGPSFPLANVLTRSIDRPLSSSIPLPPHMRSSTESLSSLEVSSPRAPSTPTSSKLSRGSPKPSTLFRSEAKTPTSKPNMLRSSINVRTPNKAPGTPLSQTRQLNSQTKHVTSQASPAKGKAAPGSRTPGKASSPSTGRIFAPVPAANTASKGNGNGRGNMRYAGGAAGIRKSIDSNPFSEARIQAAIQAGEVAFNKRGAVDNSPPDKLPAEVKPWSPVKKEKPGPFDCTKKGAEDWALCEDLR